MTSALTISGTVVGQSINSMAQINGVWVGSGVSINAAALVVNASGSLNADMQGYVAGAGLGGAPAGSSAGGSYGGLGGTGYGIAPSSTYGSTINPTDLGSGGGTRCCGTIPGAGGGALLLTVSGTLTDNGIISANGGNGIGSQVGGGSGGTVSIHTAAITGSGSLAANGGSGGEAGAGGGRVALYFNVNNGLNLTQVTANGGGSSNGSAGAPGTVYTLGAGTNLTVSANTVLPANANLTYSSIAINNQGTLSLGAGTNLAVKQPHGFPAPETFTVGGNSTVNVNGPMVVSGNSNIILQSVNNTVPFGGNWAGAGVTLVAASIQVDAGSSINADQQGYIAGAGPGGAPAGSSAGGSYGGLGGVGYGTLPLATYGSASNPTDLGSGGSARCCGVIAGPGGGAMRLIITGALTDNGTISADGGSVGSGLQGGGGSGGSIFIVSGSLAGAGSIRANGGTGGEAGGGGGRIAVFYLTNGGFNLASIMASGGQNGNAGAAGTVDAVNGPASVFLLPTATVIHGTATIVQWFTNNGGPSTVTLAGPRTATVATGTGGLNTATLDTTAYPDGSYQLVLTALNNAGQVAQQSAKNVVINNSVQWHSGTLTTSQTWGPTPVQAIDGIVVVPAGVTLTIAPGTIVKALPGSQIIVQSGGTLIASGTTGSQVTFTTFDDYTLGGNTDFNQGISVPYPGEWNGIGVLTGGTFTSNGNTILRYVETTLSGTLPAATTLYSTQVYQVARTLVVPGGGSLTIQPGAIIKFMAGAGIDVQPGATLAANGTLAQPIYMTSVNDTSVGGSVGSVGMPPAPGDWNSIYIDAATATFKHVQMQYGGGPVGGGNQAGMLETNSTASLLVDSSTLAYSYAIGFQSGLNGGGDTDTITNSTFYGNEDRAINGYGGSVIHVVNSTFDSNGYGIFAHGAIIDVANSAITNSVGTQFGQMEICCGGSFSSLKNNDVYASASGVSNYLSFGDPTGTNGNISVRPVYMNGPQHDYRPTYGSPLIDAANGTVPNYPATDSFGFPRYNAPLVTNKTGTSDLNGLYPDIGAFEFEQSAPSNLDFTASNVNGPSAALVGTQATVTWTVTNVGSGTAYGPWHDSVYLITDPNTNPVEVLAGTVLEGSGVVLGPGATYSATGTITVPGTVVGEHRWEVKTNVLGEVFEGVNTANNTAIALNSVVVDLPQLILGAAPVNGTFTAQGQSFYYKVVPAAAQTVNVQLGLSSGATGSVQVFVGGGYVPSPQHYDYQQTTFNASLASVTIPAGAAQTYYITAYAQNLPTVPAGFTIQATAEQFSLTSVTPNRTVAQGSATLTFLGGGFTSTTRFSLTGPGGAVVLPANTFLSDSTRAEATFDLSTVSAGIFSAQASNGSTISLPNAVTITGANPVPTVPAGNVQVTVEVPEALRAGFASLITVNYTNVGGVDIAAPVLYVQASNASLREVAPPCSGCDPNFPLKYGNSFNSGLVLGINRQGPAGVLPAGASGSIQFVATPLSLGTAAFYATAIGVDLIASRNVLSYCSLGKNDVPVCYFKPTQEGAYADTAAFCSSITPPGADAGFSRVCMQVLNNSGFAVNPLTGGGPYGVTLGNIGSFLSFAGFNAMLAADATALSAQGDYEYDVQKLLAFEFNKDGLHDFNRRYHQGAFGFGPSEPFDITLTNTPTGVLENLPDGSIRAFSVASPTQTGVYLGALGDYGTAALQGDGSWLITEKNGSQLHFLVGANPGNFPLDYVQDANGSRIQVAYTGNLVSSVSDTSGNRISFQYDAHGHITQAADAAGRTASFGYDAATYPQGSAFLTSVSDAAGTTSITWNEGGSSGVGFYDDSCIATYCEAAISVASIANPDGSHIYYTYDAAGRMTGQSQDGGAQAISYTYNSNGTVSATDAFGKTSAVAFNALGLPLAYTDALAHVTRLHYDAENKPTVQIGALGDSTALSYDNGGHLAGVNTPVGNFASLAYSGGETPSSLTDAAGNLFSYGFDAAFNTTSQADPSGARITYTYDAKGNVLTRTNRRGATTTSTYNGYGLLATRTLSTGAQSVYAYDAHQNLQSVTTAAGATRYTYNAADQLTGVSYPDGTSLTYAYNAGGQRTSLTDSTGFVTNYTYDAAGRLSGLTNGVGARIVSYTYDANGNLLTKAFGNGTSTSFLYDAVGNKSSVIHRNSAQSVIAEYDYTYDANNRPLTQKTPTGTIAYAYDLDGQMTSVTTPGGTIQYTYDPAGNRTAVTTNGAASNYLPNNLNEYQAANGAAFTYDADGNLLSGNGVAYSYDEDSRLLAQTSANDSWSYTYDGLGNRISSTHNGVTTRFLIDPYLTGYVAAELSSTGAVQAHYVYGLDLTSSVQATGAVSYYHFDVSGNTTQVTNAAGTVADSYVYLPFGEKTVLASSVNNPFTYSGQFGVRDEGSGLYAMNQRFYSPALGRFQQQDMGGFAGNDTNLYRYAANSPIQFSDPRGTNVVEDVNNSYPVQAINAASPFVQSAGGQLGVGFFGAVSTNISLAGNIRDGNTAGIIHDTTLNVLGAVGTYLPAKLAPGPLGVLQGVIKYANTIDVVSNNVFDGFFSYYYSNDPFNHPDNPLLNTTPPPNPCGGCITVPGTPVKSPVRGAIDPNGKIASGFGDFGFIPAGVPVTYTIFFENQSTATLPAQRVIVTDALSNNFDWSTVQFTQVAFNNTALTLPAGAQTYSGKASVSTDTNPVNVTASLNPSTGVITWTMQSVDPVTGGTPANPLAGFLPPNNASNAGFGSVTFTVMPKSGLANATSIANQGSITFDANAPILTNTVTNTLDTATPTSSITPLPASTTNASFNVGWTGSDPTGAGIASYNIYVSIDGGAYSLWLSATTLTNSTYVGVAGHTYAFVSLATNNVGIQQSTTPAPQTTTVIASSAPTVTVTPAAGAITTAQTLSVGIALASSSGTPTGSVVLSSGAYTSAAVSLSAGNATIVIPAGAIAVGMDTLTASYTPDAAGAGTYLAATGTASVTVTAAITTQQVSVGTSPAGASFTVDGTTYNTSQTFTWTIGSTHTLSTASPQTNAGTQLSFLSWSDSGAPNHTVTAATSTSSYTATFATSYLLTTAATPVAGGTVTPATGTYYPAGTVVSLVATPSAGYTFSSWTGPVASSINASTTVTMTATQSVAANFTLTPIPGISLTPTSLAFTSTAGFASAAQTVQLRNTGTAALIISSVALTGPNAAFFSQTNTCGTSVAAGVTCTLSITFTPTAPGSFAAALALADNAAASPQTVTLSGTATVPLVPAAALTPTSLNFTSVAGLATSAQTVQVANTGTAPLSITAVALSGANATLFAQTSTCGSTLAVGANCSISVTFNPTSVGSFSAALTVTDNAGNSPQTVALSGTATAPATFKLGATPTSLPVLRGGAASFVITATSQGGVFNSLVNLTVSGLPNGAVAVFQPPSITPGASGASSNLTVQTPANSALLHMPGASATAAAALGVLLFLGRRKRALLRGLVLAMLALAVVGSLSGCAGKSGSGVYTLTITGTSGTGATASAQTTTVTLIVQ